MAYRNAAAYVKGRLPRTKRELKDAVASHPETVSLRGTSMFDTFSLPLKVSSLGSHTYQVVGPNSERERKWYASITVKNGKVVCS